MELWSRVLVVDDSRVAREILQVLLKPYTRWVGAVSSGNDAKVLLETAPDAIDLVLSDLFMPDGDGLELLEWIRRTEGVEPDVLLTSARPTPEVRARGLALGAVDLLAKPLTLRAILASYDLVKRAVENRELLQRWRCGGTAIVVDPAGEGRVLSWDVYNISRQGALLESKAPVAIGTEIDLVLHIGGSEGRARARVVRIQEPSWIDVAGIGVEFTELSPGAERILARLPETDPAG
jgi:DNA-binding response OmpR family regulator